MDERQIGGMMVDGRWLMDDARPTDRVVRDDAVEQKILNPEFLNPDS
jgi:hypothetical protein